MKQRILELLRKSARHELVHGSALLFVGSIIASVFSFLFNLFLARRLSYGDYGVFAALLAIVTLVTIPSQSLTIIIVKFATDYLISGRMEQASELYIKTLRLFIVTGCLIVLGFLIFSGPIESFLHITNPGYIFLTGLIVAFIYVGIANGAFLQSLLKFGFISICNIAGSFLKLIVGILLVMIGWRIYGALGGVLTAFLLPLILTFFPLRFLLMARKKNVKLPLKEIFTYSLPSTIAILSLSSFISMDVVLVKHFFSAGDAGLYAGLSLIGKVLFYFTGPIPLVMFPLLIKRYTRKERFQDLFYMALLLVLVPSLAIVTFYFLFPKFTIQFFLGGRQYFTISPYLWIFGLYLTLFNVVNVFLSFFLSIKAVGITYVIFVGAVIQIILISLFHSNFYMVIFSSAIDLLAIFIVFLLYYFKRYAISS